MKNVGQNLAATFFCCIRLLASLQVSFAETGPPHLRKQGVGVVQRWWQIGIGEAMNNGYSAAFCEKEGAQRTFLIIKVLYHY